MCRPCNKGIDVTQMCGSALRSQAKGKRHKKQEKVMSRTFVNFFVKGETKIKPQLNTFALKRVHCDII